MLIYALKMWPGDTKDIKEVNPDKLYHSISPSYNLWGQKVSDNQRGIVIQDGMIKIK